MLLGKAARRTKAEQKDWEQAIVSHRSQTDLGGLIVDKLKCAPVLIYSSETDLWGLLVDVLKCTPVLVHG